jgi:hypothetical protein
LNIGNYTSWTIEGFFYQTYSQPIHGTLIYIGHQDASANTIGVDVYLVGDGGSGNRIGVVFSGGTTNNFAIASGATVGEWHHFAVTFYPNPDNSGNYLTNVFLDGVGAGTANFGTYTPTPLTGYLTLFGCYTYYGGLNNFTGATQPNPPTWLSEVRISSSQVYTANFTPPTVPFPVPPPGYDVYRDGVSIATFLNGDLYYDDTVPTGGIYTYNVAAYGPTQTLLLLHFDGTNGQTTTVDSSGNNVPVTLSSLGALSTTEAQFGSSSLRLPGNTYFPAPYFLCAVPQTSGGPLDIFRLNAWTVEFWFYLDPYVTTQVTFMQFGANITADSNTGFTIMGEVNTSNTAITVVAFDTNLFGTNTGISTSINISSPTWHHFALVSYEGLVTLYVDGVAASFQEDSWTPANYHGVSGVNQNIAIGSFSGYTGYTQTGYLDEVRISNIAEYTANFTPPTAPFSVVGGDISPLSEPLVLDINAPAIPLYGKFVGPSVYKPVLIGDSAGIEPRIWKPRENNTVQP